ncbi:uncharacterized protein LOC128233590 [Mya arenaria]|uniref:uncharacterized protein LOC128233590 n=1 Tax=Mya arenaria TaxID=6604 RepID=UPI0022E28B00|nr:uncharacterized protein LOC128233590 [Mya arenaria]
MEEGSDPILNMPEYIHDENTTVSCEVSNARPPASIEILVDNQAISEAVQNDILDETSKTFASKALILKIDKQWNGKKICCRRYSIINGNIKATCKTLDIKLQTQPFNISLYNVQNGTQYFDSTTGETVILKGSSMNDAHANGLFDKITRSFKFLLKPILIGTGAFVVLCIFVASARTLVRWHKGRNRTRDPDNTNGSQKNNFNPFYFTTVTLSAIESPPSLDTNEYVEMPATSMAMNASHDLADDHVGMGTREDSMMARKPITAIESAHGESSLNYADLDIDHLQQSSVGPIPGPRPTIGKEAPLYEDITFSNTKPVGLH